MTHPNLIDLKPCPNPWCCAKSPPLLCALKRDGWRVLCECGVSSWRKPTDTEAIAAWNTRTNDTLTAALDDAIVTLSAVRCVSLSPDWEDSGPHFHGVIGETLQRIATLTKGSGS